MGRGASGGLADPQHGGLEGQVAALSLCSCKQPARSGVTNTADEAA